MPCQYSGAARRARDTLKITIDEKPRTITLLLEGRAAGPWVDELKKAWNSLISKESKKVQIDLRGLTHISTEGKRVLTEMHSQTGADFIADSPMTKYFAEEARRKNSIES